MTIKVSTLITRETTFYFFPVTNKDDSVRCYLKFKLGNTGSLEFIEESESLPLLPHEGSLQHLDANLTEEQIEELTGNIDATIFTLNQILGSKGWSISVI